MKNIIKENSVLRFIISYRTGYCSTTSSSSKLYLESPQKPNPNLAMNADVTKMMFKICEADPQGT